MCAPSISHSLSLWFLFSLPGSISSASSQSSGFSEASAATPSGSGGQKDYGGLDFKIVVDFKNGSQVTIHLVAPSMQEKAAWTSDISQVGIIIYFLLLIIIRGNEFSMATHVNSILDVSEINYYFMLFLLNVHCKYIIFSPQDNVMLFPYIKLSPCNDIADTSFYVTE